MPSTGGEGRRQVGTTAGRVYGWVQGRGNTGVPSQLLEEGPMYSEAGPGRPTGPGVGGTWEPDVRGTVYPHPAGPVGPCRPSLGYTSQMPPLGQ